MQTRRRSHEHLPSKQFIKLQATELVKFSQSLMLSWFEDLRYKDLSNNCLVIVIIYAKCINRRITSKAIVVVDIKL